jgi:hypothetical protein
LAESASVSIPFSFKAERALARSTTERNGFSPHHKAKKMKNGKNKLGRHLRKDQGTPQNKIGIPEIVQIHSLPTYIF